MHRSALPLVVGLLGVLFAPRVITAEHRAELRDLRDLDEIRELVDRDQTIPRLVLLLSPT